MRPKFVLGLMLFALLVLVAALVFKQHTGSKTAPVAVAPAPAVPETAANAAPEPPPPPVPIAPPPAPMTDEERQAAIDAEIGRLQDWSMNDDPASLSNILLDLTNSEKDVREAAIEAAKQFDSTNAILVLKAAAVNSTNTDEQIEMLQAAEFLTLPPLRDMPSLTPQQIEAVKEKQAQRVANWQAQQQQQRQQNQNGQPAPPANPTPQNPGSPASPLPGQGQP